MFVIVNSEVDSVLSGQYFLTMTLHRKEHSNGENHLIALIVTRNSDFFLDFYYTKVVISICFFDL